MNLTLAINLALASLIIAGVLRYVINVPAVFRKYQHNRRSGFNRVRSLVIAWKWVL